MSVAAEIGRLKELLDLGALTTEEFEEAKRSLLQELSNPPRSSLTKESLVGKWKVQKPEGGYFDLWLGGDGKCQLDLTQDSSIMNHSSVTRRLAGIASNTGQWWLDDRILKVKVKLGNAATRFFIGITDKKSLAGLDVGFSIQVTTVSQDTILGTFSGSTVRMWRLQ